MRILSIQSEPIALLTYLNAGPKGGTVPTILPIVQGTVDHLPGDATALLCTADLQGVALRDPTPGRRPYKSEPSVLLGVALANQYPFFAEAHNLPPAGQVGVVLAGDLYSAPQGDVRGATGDVTPVWDAFDKSFCFVTGVFGNHDLFGESAKAKIPSWIAVLDGKMRAFSGLRVAGVSGIIGSSHKPNRRSSEEQLTLISRMVEQNPSLLVLHEGPDNPTHPRQRGNPEIRELLLAADQPLLVVCGHCHWTEPLVTLPGGKVQVLNCDGRVVLLTQAS